MYTKKQNRIFPAGVEHNAFLASVSDAMPYIWNDINQLRMNLHNNGSTTKPLYVWDMHRLSKSILQKLSKKRKKLKDWPYLDNTDIFSPIWCSSYKSDAGSAIIEPLQTNFTVNSLRTFNSNRNIFRVQLSYHPLIDLNAVTSYTFSDQTNIPQQSLLYGTSESYNAELVAWQSAIVPGFPILITNSLPEHAHFGPLFMEQFGISTSEMRAISVQSSYVGSKAVMMPNIYEDFWPNNEEKPNEQLSYKKAPYPARFTTEYDLSEPYQNFNKDEPAENDIQQSDDQAQITVEEYHAYRTANLNDCMAIWTYNKDDAEILPWTNFQEVKEAFEQHFWFDQHGQLKVRIRNISLNIAQNLDFTSTGTSALDDMLGPKYVAVTNRQVSGSIQLFIPHAIFNRERGLRYPGHSLALYFGGPFLFIMPNVDFQEPIITGSTGGFIVDMNFNASAAPGAQTEVPYEYFQKEYDVGDFSEFLVPFDILEPDLETEDA